MYVLPFPLFPVMQSMLLLYERRKERKEVEQFIDYIRTSFFLIFSPALSRFLSFFPFLPLPSFFTFPSYFHLHPLLFLKPPPPLPNLADPDLHVKTLIKLFKLGTLNLRCDFMKYFPNFKFVMLHHFVKSSMYICTSLYAVQIYSLNIIENIFFYMKHINNNNLV